MYCYAPRTKTVQKDKVKLLDKGERERELIKLEIDFLRIKERNEKSLCKVQEIKFGVSHFL